MRARLPLLVSLVAMLTGTALAAQSVVTPPPGSAERKALIDLLRPRVEAQIGFPVVFVVETLNVSGDWAFAVVEPRRVGGEHIAVPETRLSKARPIDAIDGLRTEAVFHKTGGRWRLSQYAIGATDLWYEPYCRTAPKGLIPVCG